jgi:uncharacterized short protein YbdD (DUF466 family)
MKVLFRVLHKGWKLLRRLSGDDAYERYLQHWHLHHREGTPLNRADFQRMECERRWNGPGRCC